MHGPFAIIEADYMEVTKVNIMNCPFTQRVDVLRNARQDTKLADEAVLPATLADRKN